MGQRGSLKRNLIVFWTKWKKHNLSKFGGDSTQIVLRVKFVAKKKDLNIIICVLHKKLEKEEHIKSKIERRKEIIKIRSGNQ